MSKLQELREKLNLTQEELAEKSGVSSRTIQRIEAGARPGAYTLKALAKALGVAEAHLKNGEPEATPIDIAWVKLLNLSALPFMVLPPLNILVPLFLMYQKKAVHPISRQIISIQLLWTIVSTVLVLLTPFAKRWFAAGNQITVLTMLCCILSNLLIILWNAAALDKKQQLSIKLNFNLL